MTLDELKKGESAVILSVNCDMRVTKRLYDMGVTEGERVTRTHSAPFGGPVVFEISDRAVAIRRADAAKIVCEK